MTETIKYLEQYLNKVEKINDSDVANFVYESEFCNIDYFQDFSNILKLVNSHKPSLENNEIITIDISNQYCRVYLKSLTYFQQITLAKFVIISNKENKGTTIGLFNKINSISKLKKYETSMNNYLTSYKSIENEEDNKYLVIDKKYLSYISNSTINKYFDQHIHCSYSEDSKEELENYAINAVDKGYPILTVTDHLEYDFCHRNIDWIPDFNSLENEVNKLNQKYLPLYIQYGVEIGYKPDLHDKFCNVIKENSFSIINLSIHQINGLDCHHPEEIKANGVDKTLTDYFRITEQAVSSGIDFDVLCHIDYCFKTAKVVDPLISIEKYKDILTNIFNIIIYSDKTFEINTKVQNTINDLNHTKFLLNLYKSLGGKNLTISSDAHKVVRYGDSFDKYIRLAKECGFDHLCYFINRKRFDFPI